MLRSLDDPRSDEWRRVDCTLQFYQDLLTKPPNKAMEPMEQARAQQALQAAEQKEISSADAEEAQKLKQEGNSCFGNQQFEEATAKYDQGVSEFLRIRGDLPLKQRQGLAESESCPIGVLGH